MTSWRSYKGSSLNAWPRLAYKVKGNRPNCLLEARGTPEVQKKIKALRQNSRTDNPGQEKEEPVLGEGVGWGSGKAPPLHTQAGSSPPPWSILMSSSTTSWKASSCSTSLGIWRTGHSDEMLPHRKKRNQGSRSSLRWMRSWVLNWTCLQT